MAYHFDRSESQIVSIVSLTRLLLMGKLLIKYSSR